MQETQVPLIFTTKKEWFPNKKGEIPRNWLQMRLKLPANTKGIHLSSLSLPPAAPPHENNPAPGDNGGFVASGAAAAYTDNRRRMLCRNMHLMSYWGGTQALSHPLLFSFSFLKCATTHITPQQPTLSMHRDFFPWFAGQSVAIEELIHTAGAYHTGRTGCS